MRNGTAFLTFIAATVATPAFAQVWSDGAPSGDTGSWHGSPSLSAPRATPNTQPTPPSQPVTSQPALPSWYPGTPGMPLAGGTLYRDVTVGTFFDDNVFASTTNRMSDWAFFARPELGWVKQGQNYTVTADGFIEGRDYATFTSENQINGSVGGGFTTMPDDHTQILGNARYIHAHLDRGSSETVVTVPGTGSTLISTLFLNPISYDEGIESAALNKRYGNWWSSLGAAGLEVHYQNATIGDGIATGIPVDLSYADGEIVNGNARLGYVVRPLTSVFVELAANTRDWEVSYFNSNGFRAVAGLLFEQGAGAWLKGEIWAGYMDQHYRGATMSNISTWTFGLGLAAVLTTNITAVFEGHREAKESALGLALLPSGALGASADTCTMIGGAVCVSTLETEVGGRLDYQLAPKLVVGVGTTYLEDDYEGALSFGRVDRTLGPLASVKYLMTPTVTLGFDYRNVAFHSGGGAAPLPFTSIGALPYSRNVYMLSMNAKW